LYRVGLIGTGNMGQAMLRAWIDSDTLKPSEIIVTDREPEKAADAVESFRVAGGTLEEVGRSEVVVLAVKPQVLSAVAAEIREPLAECRPVVVSIAAGQTLHKLAGLLPPGLAIVRVMPNVNAMIGEGMAAVCGNAHATPEQVGAVIELFAAVGQAIELPEKDFPAFTAVAASGPAFVFTFIDALARAALKSGVPKPLAVRIAAQTVLGSAKLVLERAADGATPADLADMVSSPGGTTIAGLIAAEEAGFSPAVVRAVDATIARDRELGALA